MTWEETRELLLKELTVPEIKETLVKLMDKAYEIGKREGEKKCV